MEEKCFKCERNEEEVKLVDAVSDDEIVKICEDCNIGENLPMIRKPSTFQLKESEKPYTMKERLRSMAGLPEEAVKKEVISIDSLRKKDYGKILDEKFLKQEKIPLSLIDNYNWHISMARKKKKLTRKQLADMIGESETAIKMIENKELVEDALILIKKLEQFFGIKLREDIDREEIRVEESIRKRFGKVLEKKIEIKNEIEEKKEEPSVVLKFDKKPLENLTIDDLRKMKEARERKEKQKRAKEKEKEIEEDVSKLIWRVEREEQAREKKWSKKSEENLFSDEIEILDE